MLKHFKNPLCWVSLAFVCYLLSMVILITWLSVLFAFVGIGLAMVALKLLRKHEKNKKGRKHRKLSILEKGSYAGIVVVVALCVSAHFNLLAPLCWLVVLASGMWYLLECAEEYVKEYMKSKSKKK